MARPPSRHPTELELEILKVLWQNGPLTVRQVRERLAPERELAHTSVMTVMGIMTEKKYLRRKSTSAGYVYSPRIEQNRTLGEMLGDIVDRGFSGSRVNAILQLLNDAELDDEELRLLRETLQKKKR